MHPSNAEETVNPISPAPIPKSCCTASTAPLMTAVSNPNRNPPSAATREMITTRPVWNDSSSDGCRDVCCVDMRTPLPGPAGPVTVVRGG